MNKRELVKKLVREEIGEEEREQLLDMLIDNPIAVDVDKQEKENLTFGDKLADKVSAIAGSWPFIFVFILFLILWMVINVKFLDNVDPYPFILLNLVLSCIAAIQAPIIMMSQNREAKKDSLRNQNDYITDLKSELILEELHDKLEEILENQEKIMEFYQKDSKK
ncbi:MAG: DUF1003 domain-containing protein [Bacilli bacterium]|nr:DUF1003 domain-containing protein [Bacilli bacterium]